MKKVIILLLIVCLGFGIIYYFYNSQETVEQVTDTLNFNGQELSELYTFQVVGTGKTVSDLYSSIGPDGPIKPYDLMCGSSVLHNLGINGEGGYDHQNVLYPAWFHAPGTYVSQDTICSLDKEELKKLFPEFKEIGS